MRITKKLKAAAEMLSDESIADCSPTAFVQAAARLHVTAAQMYSAMRRLGYTWTGTRWQRNLPSWLNKLVGSLEE